MLQKIKKYLAISGRYYLASFFLLSNALIFALSFENADRSPKSIVSFFQFWLLLYVLYYWLPRKAAYPVILLTLFAYYFLVCYAALIGAPLDIILAVRRWDEFVYLGKSYVLFALFLLLVAATNAWIITKLKKIVWQPVVIFILAIIASGFFASNELFDFLRQIALGNKGVDYYERQIYAPLVKESSELKKKLSTPAIRQEPKLGNKLNHIVMVQLESLNARLIGPTTTPNLIALAKRGVFFPAFYGNSIQTILAQENILCSLPSSFVKDLVYSGRDTAVACLPSLVKGLGYKSYFFESSHLGFEHTGDFMSHIGFDEVHGYDTMRPGDPQFPWGREEGVFLDRTIDYLKASTSTGKSLVYMTFAATNHWPFNNGASNNDSAGDFKERLAASTARQDKYLAGLNERLDELYPEKDYTLWVFGDHSWPAAIQSKNYFNQRNALDENFLTAMVVVVGGDTTSERVVNSLYSHMDTLPSIMELLGQPLPASSFRRSYVNELLNAGISNQKQRILLIQPYSDRYVVLMNDDAKYSFNTKAGSIKEIGLASDFFENGKILSSRLGESMNLFSNLIK